MNLLQSGVPKSGNFWLYNIIQRVLLRSGKNTTSFIERQPVYTLARDWDLNFPDQARIDVLEISDLQCRYRISSIFQMPIEDIKAYISEAPHVWTHSPVCKKSPEVFKMFDKIVYIIRDPRDVAVSASKYFCSDYMLKYFPQEDTLPEKYLEHNFKRLIKEWVWHVFDHIRLSLEHNIYVVFYENLLDNFMDELEKLLHYLQISLNHDQMKAIGSEVSFSTLKKENPGHVRKGKYGNWTKQLSTAQIENAFMIAGPLLSFLNYPIDKDNARMVAPSFNYNNIDGLKKELFNQTYLPNS